MPQAHFLISGRVQGVGFRAFVRGLAEELGVEGAVWNTRDDKVETVAEHESEMVLEEFLSRLWDGPGYVSSIIRSEGEESNLGPGFEVRPTI